MQYGDLKAQFTELLNRSDCTDSLVVTFLKQATTRIQRELRIPAMERFLGSTTATGFFPVPTDYIELKELMVDGQSLEKKSVRQLMAMPAVSGVPKYYARMADQFLLRPLATAGTEVVAWYYGEFEDLPLDTSFNGLTECAPDLLIYGALSYAADYFEMEKAADWEGRYQSILAALQQQANDDEFNGGPMSIQAAYQEY